VTLDYIMGGKVPVHVKMVNCYYDDVYVEQVLVEELPTSNMNDGGAIMLAARHLSETDANNATSLSKGNGNLISVARLLCERDPPGIQIYLHFYAPEWRGHQRN